MEIQAPTILKPCSVRSLVYTCTSCNSSHNPKECRFEMIWNVELCVISHFENTRQCQFGGFQTSSPRSSYHALSTVNTWREYFTEISRKGKRELESFANPDFSLNKIFFSPCQGRRRELRWRIRIVPCFMVHQRCRWHWLVGAREREIVSLRLFEELLHLLPALQILKVV